MGEYKTSIGRRKTKPYTLWINMLKRCYSEKCHIKQPTYKETIVCEEWHNFQNFAKWHEENWKHWMSSSWHLDKDILIKSNKIYSPETCGFVPQQINKIFNTSTINRGEYPIGVSFVKNGYTTSCYINNICNYLGRYKTPEEAFQVYKITKEEYIKEMAEHYKEQISKVYYQALINYKVEITD